MDTTIHYPVTSADTDSLHCLGHSDILPSLFAMSLALARLAARLAPETFGKLRG